MTLEDGFLRAIVADPGDDASRLVYADWLDENSQPERAEFIRGQIHLANVREDSLPRRKVARRVRELLEKYGEVWPPETPYVHHWHYRRGFIDKVGLHGEDLKEHAAHLFSAVPLTRLWTSRLEGTLAPLQEIPPENTLTSLDLTCNGLTFDFLEELATFDHLPHLRTLVLQCNALDDSCVPWLCEHPFFQRLSLIRFGANPISQAGRERLREHFGGRVSFVCERDEDHLYAMQDDRFDVGLGNDDVQLLYFGYEGGIRVAVFDHEGRLLGVHRREVPGRDLTIHWQEEWQQKRGAAKQAWKAELGFESGTIRFLRFETEDGKQINDFNWWQDAFDDWDHPQAEVRDGVDAWLMDGQYEYGDCWLDGNGEVTDS